jgi:hypothetical protein
MNKTLAVGMLAAVVVAFAAATILSATNFVTSAQAKTGLCTGNPHETELGVKSGNPHNEGTAKGSGNPHDPVTEDCP